MNVRENIKAGKYEPAYDPLPKFTPLPADQDTTLAKKAHRDEYEKARAKVNSANHENQRAINDQFKADLFEEHKVVEHPKAERIYNMAYDQANGAGFEEVCSYFEDLVDLIKP